MIVRMRIQLIQLQVHSAHTGHSQRSAGGEVPALQATLVRWQPRRERRASQRSPCWPDPPSESTVTT